MMSVYSIGTLIFFYASCPLETEIEMILSRSKVSFHPPPQKNKLLFGLSESLEYKYACPPTQMKCEVEDICNLP